MRIFFVAAVLIIIGGGQNALTKPALATSGRLIALYQESQLNAGAQNAAAARQYPPCQPENAGQAQAKPAIPEIDHIRLAETFRLGDRIADRVWRNWSKAPFAVLLVTPDYEFLIRHPKPSDDFAKLPYDLVLKSVVYYRKRTLPTSFLATFPAVRGSMISTIVVGEAENTWVKTSTPWIIRLLHEHFHQLQDS